jgi:hypothetical protein
MKWVKQTMCNINRSIIKNKEGRQLRRFYIFMLHTAVYVAVPKLVMYVLPGNALPCRWRQRIAWTHITGSVNICVQGTRSLLIAYLDDCMVFYLIRNDACYDDGLTEGRNW